MYDNRYALCLSSDAVLVTAPRLNPWGQGDRSYNLKTREDDGRPAEISALRARVAEFLNHASNRAEKTFVVDPAALACLGHQMDTLMRFFEDMGPIPQNVLFMPPAMA